MKIIVYVLYTLWAILAIVAKIFLGASWWVATSWIWLPVAVLIILSLALTASVDLGTAFKKRAEEKTPKTCENCLFGQTAKYGDDNKCLGESLEETIKRPTLCKFYKRGTN